MQADEIRIEKEISNKAWELLLQYFYTRNYKEFTTDPTDCLDVLRVASHLKLDVTSGSIADKHQNHAELLTHCDTIVYNSITDDNALARLLEDINRDDSVDKQITFRFWVKNYERLFAKYENELTTLPKRVMFMLMNRVIQHEMNNKK